MNPAIASLQKTRAFVRQITDSLTDEELNIIPAGFSNNIVWNMAHLIAAEQGICYIRGGAQPFMPAEFIAAYTRGTKPETVVSGEGIAELMRALTDTPARLQRNYDAGTFRNYKAWTTPFGVELTNIDEALQFILFHEGIHTGYIMAMKRAIKGQMSQKTAPAAGHVSAEAASEVLKAGI